MGSCSAKEKSKRPKNQPISASEPGTNTNNTNFTSAVAAKSHKQLTKQTTDFKVGPEIFVTLRKGDILNTYKVEQTLGEGIPLPPKRRLWRCSPSHAQANWNPKGYETD